MACFNGLVGVRAQWVGLVCCGVCGGFDGVGRFKNYKFLGSSGISQNDHESYSGCVQSECTVGVVGGQVGVRVSI